MERYQLNLQRSFQSLVPMERVAWNLANSGIEVDFSLFGSIRFYLQRSIYRVVSTLKRLKQMKIPVIQQVWVLFSSSPFFIPFNFRRMMSNFDSVKSAIASCWSYCGLATRPTAISRQLHFARSVPYHSHPQTGSSFNSSPSKNCKSCMTG